MSSLTKVSTYKNLKMGAGENNRYKWKITQWPNPAISIMIGVLDKSLGIPSFSINR